VARVEKPSSDSDHPGLGSADGSTPQGDCNHPDSQDESSCFQPISLSHARSIYSRDFESNTRPFFNKGTDTKRVLNHGCEAPGDLVNDNSPNQGSPSNQLGVARRRGSAQLPAHRFSGHGFSLRLREGGGVRISVDGNSVEAKEGAGPYTQEGRTHGQKTGIKCGGGATGIGQERGARARLRARLRLRSRSRSRARSRSGRRRPLATHGGKCRGEAQKCAAQLGGKRCGKAAGDSRTPGRCRAGLRPA